MSRGKKKREKRTGAYVLIRAEVGLKDQLWYSESAAAKEITFSGTC